MQLETWNFFYLFITILKLNQFICFFYVNKNLIYVLKKINLSSLVEEAISSNDVWIGCQRTEDKALNSDFQLLNGEYLFASRANPFEQLLYYWSASRLLPRDTELDQAVVIRHEKKALENLPKSQEFYGLCEIGYY